MATKETYRVEKRLRYGWVALTQGGLSARKANRAAELEREHQSYYGRLGAKVERVRVVRESDGKGLWLA